MLLSVDDQLMVFVSPNNPTMPALGLFYIHFIEVIMSSFLVSALLKAHENRKKKKARHMYMNTLKHRKKCSKCFVLELIDI